MKRWTYLLLPAAVAVFIPIAGVAQESAAPPQTSQPQAVKSTVDEVLLDFVVRDKKGRPVTDLKPGEVSVLDNGAKQEFTSFRLVQSSEAGQPAASQDPQQQMRLVTLVFDAVSAPDQRRTARTAALDLIKGAQDTNTFYSVFVIDTRLMVLQPFTEDPDTLGAAIKEATAGYAPARLLPESERIKSDLRRSLSGPPPAGAAAIQAKLAAVVLGMLHMDAAIAADAARMSIAGLQSLTYGLQQWPGRKSVLYFTKGMTLTPELDTMFRNLTSMANRANVTFYSVDTRGVIAGYESNTRDVSTGAQNAGAADQLGGAAAASGTTVTRTDGFVTKEEVLASDNAEVSGRANVQLAVRNLAEATGGFLIGESNDLRTPLRHVNEEISSYYELSYNPHIDNYDGSFRKLKIDVERKDVRVYARNGYFALPAEARASGMQTYEVPLLKAISDGKLSADVEYHAGAILLEPRHEATDIDVLVEVPLNQLQAKTGPSANKADVHVSIGALVKNRKGEVVERLTRDRSLRITAEQLKLAHFVEKLPATAPPGEYVLESAVIDRESGKIGVQRSEFAVPQKPAGPGISSLMVVRSFSPARQVDSNDPFQFQGQAITPTLNEAVQRAENSVLRLFFVVYPERSLAGKPTAEIEFLQSGKSLMKAPLELPDADAQGKIPYVMTIPAAGIPPGTYQIRATTRQGNLSAATETLVKIE